MNQPNPNQGRRRWRFLAIIGPGLLVAATGVGAGDLWTAGFTGEELGVKVLWAVLLGAFFKFVLTEGLARWQLATGQTLLEGAVCRLGRPIQYAFLFYLSGWTVFVGSALVNACGVTAHAMFPIFDPEHGGVDYGKISFGVLHSVIGVILVRSGGFRLFEKLMGVCIGIMFITVIITAMIVQPDWPAVARGLVIPTIPQLNNGGLTWTVALMGGVGGTLTVLCYGYWIRENQRQGTDDLSVCRIDLGVGYTMTALFGICMVIIGSEVQTEAKGTSLLLEAGKHLHEKLGVAARWMFLVGAWAAVFSSLLGVWQAVPYIFADYCRLAKHRQQEKVFDPQPAKVDTNAPPYRWYLVGLAVVSMLGLTFDFKLVQKYYAVVGALFMPMLAAALLILNGNTKWIGPRFRNRPLTVVVLVATLAFFAWYGWTQVSSKWR